ILAGGNIGVEATYVKIANNGSGLDENFGTAGFLKLNTDFSATEATAASLLIESDNNVDKILMVADVLASSQTKQKASGATVGIARYLAEKEFVSVSALKFEAIQGANVNQEYISKEVVISGSGVGY